MCGLASAALAETFLAKGALLISDGFIVSGVMDHISSSLRAFRVSLSEQIQGATSVR